jgi:hypothetical protein
MAVVVIRCSQEEPPGWWSAGVDALRGELGDDGCALAARPIVALGDRAPYRSTEERDLGVARVEPTTRERRRSGPSARSLRCVDTLGSSPARARGAEVAP